MSTLLFDDEYLLKVSSFSAALFHYPDLKLLKRENKNICLDVKLLNPDLLFTGVSTSADHFWEKIKSIRAANKNVKIVLLVDFYCEHIFWIAQKLEINGIIKKGISSDEFKEEIISIMDTSNNINHIESEPLIGFDQINNILTNTEKRVFTLIGKGLTSQEISDLLYISHRTVDNHRAKILNKLGCKTASKLIYVASAYTLFSLL